MYMGYAVAIEYTVYILYVYVVGIYIGITIAQQRPCTRYYYYDTYYNII